MPKPDDVRDHVSAKRGERSLPRTAPRGMAQRVAAVETLAEASRLRFEHTFLRAARTIAPWAARSRAAFRTEESGHGLSPLPCGHAALASVAICYRAVTTSSSRQWSALRSNGKASSLHGNRGLHRPETLLPYPPQANRRSPEHPSPQGRCSARTGTDRRRPPGHRNETCREPRYPVRRPGPRKQTARKLPAPLPTIGIALKR